MNEAHNHTEGEPSSVREHVFSKIERGEAQMRTRRYFALKDALVAAVILLIVFILLYLMSFILFVLRRTGVWFAPAFGFRGVEVFLASLPWFLIIVAAFFAILAEMFMRRYAFIYRKPVVYSFIAIIALVAAGGFLMSRTAFHPGMFRYVEEHEVPLMASFYRGYGKQRVPRIHVGIVTAVNDEGFCLTNPFGETSLIRVDKEMVFPFDEPFLEGDDVVVLGEQEGMIVQAQGVQRVGGREHEPPSFELGSQPSCF